MIHKPLQKKAMLVSMASYLPENVITNKDLEKLVDTSDEWIKTRTGIEERRVAGKDEQNSTMGVCAATKALEKINLNVQDIDLVLVATSTPDYKIPSTACIIQDKIGAINAAAFDLTAACTGMLYALSVARAFILSSVYKNILLIASEKLSSFVDYSDRGTCILFGDGAWCGVIQADKTQGIIIEDVVLGSDGSKADLLSIPSGGSAYPISCEAIEQGEHYIKMEGREIFKNAVKSMTRASKEVLERSAVNKDDIRYFIPHQANLRIINSVADQLSFPLEKIKVNIQKYGNTSAASLGLALDELYLETNNNKKLVTGDNLLLTAFGSGLTWGAGLLKYIGR